MVSAVDSLAAVDRLLSAAADGTLDALCERLGVRVLGVFGSAARQHRRPDPSARPPRDVDIVASFAGPPRHLELVDALVQLTGCDAIDVAVIDGTNPVLRAEAMVGIPLYERSRGEYAVTQMAALAERRDTAHLRRLDLEALRR
jgi:predicted nucleotidyltransferase